MLFLRIHVAVTEGGLRGSPGSHPPTGRAVQGGPNCMLAKRASRCFCHRAHGVQHVRVSVQRSGRSGTQQ